MVRRRLTCIAALVATLLASGCQRRTTERAEANRQPRVAAAASKPNIVLIVLDDTGFAEIGAFGSEIRTPNVDALAREGLRYNNFNTKAICSATRAALLTGRNSHTVRMENVASMQPVPDPTDDFDRGMKALTAKSKADRVALKLPKVFEKIDLSATDP